MVCFIWLSSAECDGRKTDCTVNKKICEAQQQIGSVLTIRNYTEETKLYWLMSAPEIFIGGCSPGGQGSLPVGSKGEASVRSLGMFPRRWSSLQTLFTDFGCKKDQNSKLYNNNWLPDSWPVYFKVGAKGKCVGS